MGRGAWANQWKPWGALWSSLTHIPPELEEVEQVVDVHHAVSCVISWARVGVVAAAWVGRHGVVVKSFWVKAPQIQTRSVVRQGSGIMVHCVGVCAARKQAAEIARTIVKVASSS